MAYVCFKCGEDDDFEQDITYAAEQTCYERWVRFIDHDGDWDDEDFYETIDTESTGERDVEDYGDVRCRNCDELADEIDDEDWDDWRNGQPLEEQSRAIQEKYAGDYKPTKKEPGDLDKLKQKLVEVRT